MVLMSIEIAIKMNIQPMVTIRSIGFLGVNPANMGIGPVPAAHMALEKPNLKVQDIDY
jgi:acetyl-CoA acetyltransferase